MKRETFRTSVMFHLLLAFILGAMNVTETGAVESVLNLDKKWTGDLDGMAERRLIRALVPYSKTFYFLDGPDQRGLTYELLTEFEKHINKKLRKRTLKIQLVVIPTKRDRLLPALAEGAGDIAAGNLTITPERKKWVDFSGPHLTGVDEIIVTAPKAPPIQSIADLENDPQVLANDYIIDLHHEVMGPVKVLGLPIHLSKTPGSVKCEAPELGQHTEEVLMEIGGYSWEEIADLQEKKVII